MNNQSVIYNIIGHTGCGKTTISKRVAEYYDYDLLDFSYLGNEFAKNIKEKASTEALNSYVTNCIIAAANWTKRIVVDGLVSIDTVDELKRYGICCRIIYIDTPQALCISRIMKKTLYQSTMRLGFSKLKKTAKLLPD